MEMNERIKKLRKTLDLTQREFGECIGIKGNTIAQYEIGRNEPIDAVISLICREFTVNEESLRTGTGEIFMTQTDFAINNEENEEFKTLFSDFCKLNSLGQLEAKKRIKELTLIHYYTKDEQ